MANVVRDPHQYPDAIAPDLSKPDPLVTFTKNDIAFVYGSRWKQRYFKKVGDDYYPLPWHSLKYDTNLGGYIAGITEDRLKGAPKYSNESSWNWSAPDTTKSIDDYYMAYP